MPAKPPVLVLYGSQTGNSRAMAKALGDDATEHGFDTRVIGMEQFKTLEFADVSASIMPTMPTMPIPRPYHALTIYHAYTMHTPCIHHAHTMHAPCRCRCC
eukprot:scaffold49279_cov47-Phaeocystis_antarctica.AAC.1